MKVSELIAALEEFQTKLTEHQELLNKRAGQRAELSVPQKQAALEEQSRWLSRRLGALRPYIEQFDNEWMMRHPSTGVIWDALDVVTSLTGHPAKTHSLRHVIPKLHQILGRLESLDPNKELSTDPRDIAMSGHEDWIPASSAVALLGIGDQLARRTICRHAHAGLIRARATRFVQDGQSADNVEVPSEFWWAKGEAALTQDWVTGYFETWIDQRIHLEAFGVTFSRADIEASRPAPVLANDAPRITSTHRSAKGRDIILILAERFHGVVRQIRQRHDNRPTLDVGDEYDVQDLFHALLTIYFDDIRKEEWAPSYAGGASRMDFLLPEIEAVVETKMMRQSLSTRQLGEQLIVDIAKYKSHPTCHTLFCVVYDPDGRIANPRGVENDLSSQDQRLVTQVMIIPKH